MSVKSNSESSCRVPLDPFAIASGMSIICWTREEKKKSREENPSIWVSKKARTQQNQRKPRQKSVLVTCSLHTCWRKPIFGKFQFLFLFFFQNWTVKWRINYSCLLVLLPSTASTRYAKEAGEEDGQGSFGQILSLGQTARLSISCCLQTCSVE